MSFRILPILSACIIAASCTIPAIGAERGSGNASHKTSLQQTKAAHQVHKNNNFQPPSGGVHAPGPGIPLSQWKTIPVPHQQPEHVAARELKLKVRELADQLLTHLDKKALQGMTAMPVSFVNQDNFEESSSFGRYLSETLFYEFNQRGFPVREYRTESELATKQGQGEFLLSRKQQRIYAESPLTLFVTGTYYYDKHNIFVNARLVRATDGIVLRTAALVFPQSSVSKRMIANTGQQLDSAYVGMQDLQTMTRVTDLSSFDVGEDIH